MRPLLTRLTAPKAAVIAVAAGTGLLAVVLIGPSGASRAQFTLTGRVDQISPRLCVGPSVTSVNCLSPVPRALLDDARIGVCSIITYTAPADDYDPTGVSTKIIDIEPSPKPC